MEGRHVVSGVALAASVVPTIFGMLKGAAVLVGLATVIELIASALTGKQTNT